MWSVPWTRNRCAAVRKPPWWDCQKIFWGSHVLQAPPGCRETSLCAPALQVSPDPTAPLEHLKKNIVQNFFPSSLQLSLKMWTGEGWSLCLCLQELDKKNPQSYIKIFTERTIQEPCVLWERRKKLMKQDNHRCRCLLSPAMILCAAFPLSQAQLSTAQSPGGSWVPLAVAHSFPASSVWPSSKAGMDMPTHHTPIIWKQYIFLQNHGWYLLYLEMTSKDFTFQEEEIHLAGKASLVVATVRIKCSPGVKICKYIMHYVFFYGRSLVIYTIQLRRMSNHVCNINILRWRKKDKNKNSLSLSKQPQQWK